MRRPPAIANALLTRFVPEDPALVGDVYEQWAEGRSRSWFWRQTLGAIAWGTVRDVRRMPAQTCGGIVIGWATAALVFLRGDHLAGSMAASLWHWNRQTAYADQVWWPFWITAGFVSYGGFCLSTAIVAGLYRKHAGVLIAYVAATFVLLLAAGIVMEILLRGGPLPVPHPLFYAVSVTLPYQARSGILLVPLAMLVCGALVRRPARTHLFHDPRGAGPS